MPERLFDQDRLEWQIELLNGYFFMGRRIGADAHDVRWTKSIHFPEIGKSPDSWIFTAQLRTNLRTKVCNCHQFIMVGANSSIQAQPSAGTAAHDA